MQGTSEHGYSPVQQQEPAVQIMCLPAQLCCLPSIVVVIGVFDCGLVKKIVPDLVPYVRFTRDFHTYQCYMF